MNVSIPTLPTSATPPPRPDLPAPALARWQPLRMGLIELFHYDSEEFWFRDGHLLLRGNNGTGKSKVLSLTLPFLLDAQLKSSRIEPDGDGAKKMAWNLLLGRHERRMGYAWVEFGRINEDGQPQYLTLGCGLSAAAARTQVDSWFFVLEEWRIGQDVWLTSPQRVVLTRERLRDALENHGQIFDTATSYRRAVDERLFHLGTARYAALMDTLIQLRQPQLSRKPDEGSLSGALTEALPPMSADLLTDVADALNQLEENRRQLEEYEALAKAVGQFNQRYQLYASTQARRQARTLRSAQTGFDNASRVLNAARDELRKTLHIEAQSKARFDAAETARLASRTQLDLLQADPAMQDANRLALAEREAQDRQRDFASAADALRQAEARLQREIDSTRERAERSAHAGEALAEMRESAARLARPVGIEEAYARNALAAADAPTLTALEALAFDTARNELRQLAANRRDQVMLMQRRCIEVEQTEQQHVHAQQARDERLDETDAAAARRKEADDNVERHGRAVLEMWQDHFDHLQQLRIDDARATLDALAPWVTSLQGENPARGALQAAQQRASERLAQRHALLAHEAQSLQVEREALQAEQARLEQGEDATPIAPPYRAADARTKTKRAGAPLWQLVDFRAGVDPTRRAGLEAGLEAAGLLDAWVTPEGSLHTADGAQPLHDTQWLERPVQSASLSAWLVPSTPLAGNAGTSNSVPAATVSRLLEGIACTPADDGTAETWVATDGRFRLGALAGAWTKPEASYIGYAARAAARARRLDEIARRLRQLGEDQENLQARMTEHAQHQQQAALEWQRAPTDDDLRAAHVEAASRAREFLVAGDRLDQAERRLRESGQRLQAARHALATDAEDLHLPATRTGLQDVEQTLAQFGETLHGLIQSAHELRQALNELARQREREQAAQADAAQGKAQLSLRRHQSEEAQVRLKILRESVGAKVEELQQRLREARHLVDEGEALLKTRSESLRLAGENRARAEQKTKDGESTLEERLATRQHAITQLQGFAATGLLAVALPDAELPDLRAPWTIEPALGLARRAEQAFAAVKDDDEAWTRIQSQISQDYGELGRALAALSHQAQADTSDYGLVVTIVYQNRPERPDVLRARLDAEIAQRMELLTAGEREVLENHLQAEIAAAVQKLLQDAERQVDAINKELHKRPTSTGVRFRLQWQPLPEGAEGAPVGLEAARKRLLNTSTDLWSAEDRRVVGAMLQQRIASERASADAAGGGSLLEQLARALDYRRWHRFRVQRWQDGQWRPLSGPASSGERALGLTVPLFAAVSTYYSQGSYIHAPRLVLLDEAFAGIDDSARAHCMGLIREFDLDFVITSEREWACYAELPGVSICHLQRREGIDAVHVSRWAWDGRARHREDDPDRRFVPA